MIHELRLTFLVKTDNDFVNKPNDSSTNHTTSASTTLSWGLSVKCSNLYVVDVEIGNAESPTVYIESAANEHVVRTGKKNVWIWVTNNLEMQTQFRWPSF